MSRWTQQMQVYETRGFFELGISSLARVFCLSFSLAKKSLVDSSWCVWALEFSVSDTASKYGLHICLWSPAYADRTRLI